MMDMPATSRKRPASSPLNAEACQPTASVGNTSHACNKVPFLEVGYGCARMNVWVGTSTLCSATSTLYYTAILIHAPIVSPTMIKVIVLANSDCSACKEQNCKHLCIVSIHECSGRFLTLHLIYWDIIYTSLKDFIVDIIKGASIWWRECIQHTQMTKC